MNLENPISYLDSIEILSIYTCFAEWLLIPDYTSFEAAFVAFAASMTPVFNFTAMDIESKIDEFSQMSGKNEKYLIHKDHYK